MIIRTVYLRLSGILGALSHEIILPTVPLYYASNYINGRASVIGVMFYQTVNEIIAAVQ